MLLPRPLVHLPHDDPIWGMPTGSITADQQPILTDSGTEPHDFLPVDPCAASYLDGTRLGTARENRTSCPAGAALSATTPGVSPYQCATLCHAATYGSHIVLGGPSVRLLKSLPCSRGEKKVRGSFHVKLLPSSSRPDLHRSQTLRRQGTFQLGRRAAVGYTYETDRPCT